MPRIHRSALFCLVCCLLGGWMIWFSVVLFASVSGVVFGLFIQTIRGKKKTDAFPFGPCLVMGAFAWMAGFDLARWF